MFLTFKTNQNTFFGTKFSITISTKTLTQNSTSVCYQNQHRKAPVSLNKRSPLIPTTWSDGLHFRTFIVSKPTHSKIKPKPNQNKTSFYCKIKFNMTAVTFRRRCCNEAGGYHHPEPLPPRWLESNQPW